MYDIIFNAITVESLKKFLKISGDKEIKKNQSKADLIAEIKKKIKSEKSFKIDFINYYREIEKAGRKDFWFYKLKKKMTTAEIKKIQDKIKGFSKEDEETLYLPKSETDEKYLIVKNTPQLIEVKIIRKKIISERDENKTHREGEYLYIAYKQTEVRHVTYIKIELEKKHRLLIGVDVWQNLSTREKLKEVQTDISNILGSDFFPKLEPVNLKDQSDLFEDGDNVIIKELSDKIENKNQSVSFTIDTEKINLIKRALNDGSLKLEDIKTKHIDSDVKNNEVFLAAQGRKIDLVTKGCKGAYFYHSTLTNEFEYFRFELHAAESRIKLLNDHIMLEDIQDVFSKII